MVNVRLCELFGHVPLLMYVLVNIFRSYSNCNSVILIWLCELASNNWVKSWWQINKLKLCCWNIRRGLVKREHEINELLRKEKLDVLFLVETDSYVILEEKDYTITGFKTVFPLKDANNQKTRLITLITEKNVNIKVRMDLMNPKFPSIWLEEERENESNILMCGFYREWTPEGVRTLGCCKNF